MATPVVPAYQISLLHEKASQGKALTPEEQSLVSSSTPAPLNPYLSYLKELRPSQFSSVLDSLRITPINNYRESYTLGQLLIKAWNSGQLSSLPQTEELSEFASSYRAYKTAHYSCALGSLLSLGLFNVAYAVPKFCNWPLFIGQNLALVLILKSVSCNIESRFWHSALPHVHAASHKFREELLKLHRENKVLFRYEKVIEEFPPDGFGYQNLKFLENKKMYEIAHKDDFTESGRRHSQFVLYKEGKHRLA